MVLLPPPWAVMPSLSPPASWVLLIRLEVMPVIASAPLKPPPLWVHQQVPPFGLLENLAWLVPTWDSPQAYGASPHHPEGCDSLSSQGEISCLLSSQMQFFLSSLLALVAQMPGKVLRVSNTLEPRRSLSHSHNLVPFSQRPLCSTESAISSQHKSAHGMQTLYIFPSTGSPLLPPDLSYFTMPKT